MENSGIKIRLLNNIDELGLIQNKQLSIFKKGLYSLAAEPTDLVGLTGGKKDSLGYTSYFTDKSGLNLIVTIVSEEESRNFHSSSKRFDATPSIRPVIEINSLPDDVKTKVLEEISNKRKEIDNIKKNNVNKKEIIDERIEVDLFEYPQFIETDEDIIHNVGRLINKKHQSALTGKKYSLLYNKNLIDEYSYNNSKYVCVPSNITHEFKLSDGEEMVFEGNYIVKVSPITWIVDEEKGLLISKYALLSGIPYWLNDDKTDFKESNMAEFLNNIMIKDMISIYDVREKSKYNDCINNNVFGISSLKINDVEKMKILLGAGITPFMHGFTGVGKSQRVDIIDDGHIKVYLSSSSLEDIEGKSVYIPPVIRKVKHCYEKIENEKTIIITEYIDEIVKPGYMMEIKPTWLVRLEELCEKEPDKLHLVFFDEITHAPPSLQSGVFNIVLDGEVNGIWKLPQNARAILAGNDIDESIAAYEIAEPLYGRCGNIYIEDNLDEWLLWANEKNIHPAIIGFMLATNGTLLRSKYDGENPNADPRKWEMASNILYQYKNIALLTPLVGKEITAAFNGFCNSKNVSIEDVLNSNYSDDIFKMNTNEKYATAVNLSRCNEEEYPTIREFMKRVGADACAAFDSLWIRNNPKRELIVAKVKNQEKIDTSLVKRKIKNEK